VQRLGFERHTISSEVSERALRESTSCPFTPPSPRPGSWDHVAYNKINGTWAAENNVLTTSSAGVGFDGFVISDWFGTQSTVPSPTPASIWRCRVVSLTGARSGRRRQDGEVAESVPTTNRAAVALAERTGAFEEAEQAEQSVNDAGERALVRQAAAEAIVLLKNDNAVLPLNATTSQSIAVIGPNGDIAQIQARQRGCDAALRDHATRRHPAAGKGNVGRARLRHHQEHARAR